LKNSCTNVISAAWHNRFQNDFENTNRSYLQMIRLTVFNAFAKRKLIVTTIINKIILSCVNRVVVRVSTK